MMPPINLKKIPNVLGFVDRCECSKCLNISNWKLLEVEEYFTLYYIPIIPIGRNYRIVCEICNHQEILSKKHFINYKKKIDIEWLFSENEITAQERNLKITEINIIIEKAKINKLNTSPEERKECEDLASKKTDEELLTIYLKERYQYIPAMITAVKSEIEKRNLTNKKIDYEQLAVEIAKENKETIDLMKKSPFNKQVNRFWINFGYVALFFTGGFYGIIAGSIYMYSKQESAEGHNLFIYNNSSRKDGKVMIILGCVVLGYHIITKVNWNQLY